MLLADEPVASLDPVLAHSILGYLEQLNQEDGITVLCSLHYLDLVQRYATDVIGLRGGRLVYRGTAEDIRTMSDTAVQGDLRGGGRARERRPHAAEMKSHGIRWY